MTSSTPTKPSGVERLNQYVSDVLSGEIVACKKDGHWLRYTGKAVFETDEKYAQAMIKSSGLEAIYNEQTGNKLMAFHLEDAKAVDIAVMGEGENLL